jgi:drug/metabolite transporter (DMT)-like permease
MQAIVLALGASMSWGLADFFGPLQGRVLGALRALVYVQLGGLAGIAVIVAVRGKGPQDAAALLAIPAAISGTLGLFAYYRGMQLGAMSVVAPIAGVSAVIPVVFGIATGDDPGPPQIAGMVCALAGVGLASIEHQDGSRRVATGVGLALLAALGFGIYFPWMHAAGDVDFWWASLVFRTTALLLVASAVAARRPELRLSPKYLAIALLVGVGDMLGNLLFAASSNSGLVSLTAVLASLYPVVTVMLAAAVLRERVAPLQRGGIALTLAGVVLISI